MVCDFEQPVPAPTPTHFFRAGGGENDIPDEFIPLPDAIGPGSGFNWDGDAAQFADALTEGRLFASYNGHSSTAGFAAPLVTTADIVNQLTRFTTPPTVVYPFEGAIISALQQGPSGVIPLGRAKVQNGTAQLDLVNEIQEGLPVLLAASLPGSGSVPLNSATEVPSLSNWALAAMAALLGATAAAARWRQRD